MFKTLLQNGSKRYLKRGSLEIVDMQTRKPSFLRLACETYLFIFFKTNLAGRKAAHSINWVDISWKDIIPQNSILLNKISCLDT